jgi:hypothetical protein
MRLTHVLLSSLIAASLAPKLAWADVSVENFQLRNTADLVALCTADLEGPMGGPALNFCHGFITGSFRVLNDMQAATRTPSFCVPVPAPSRNDVVAALSIWAKSNPARMASPAEDGVLDFLKAQYPCPKQGR